MELRHVRYFLAVASEMHFGRAAARLNIAQPALSIQIKALEEELGGALFDRTSRQVALSPMGQIFLPEAQKIMDQANQARDAARRAAKGELGSIRIGFVGNAFFSGLLSQDLRQFRAACPDVSIELCELPARKQADQIMHRTLDIGYVPDFNTPRHPDILCQPTGAWPFVVALSPDHALASQSAIRADALRDERFVIYALGEDDGDHLQHIAAILGYMPQHITHVANTLTVLTMASAGLGIAVVPETLSEIRIAGMCYVPLADARQTSQAAILSARHQVSPIVLRYLDIVGQPKGVK
ncbi:LysR substrate-binding domain-containing protein [Thalassospira marina]|uniref:LysR family transcriptional regulator n=1 Tax=Thalassospira marina TaxID=2048283 RepID=A0A2N3KRI4_9PROT|nr:LysR substrate-binding domain-containing protein [Thalassospira marina]PKR53155.1 LysR family transcriptional regulator [Thalassospira marina]